MAIDSELLGALAKSGYGPVTIEKTGAGYTASLGGHEARISLDGPAGRIESHEGVEWPGGEASEAQKRVDAALNRLALTQRGLAIMSSDSGRSMVVASLWIDAERGGGEDLAAAIRSATILAQLGADTVAQIAMTLQAEQELMRLTSGDAGLADPAPDVAPPPASEPPPPAPAPEPEPAAMVEKAAPAMAEPQAAPAPAVAVQAPDEAPMAAPEPATVPCVSCRAPLERGARFCMSCGASQVQEAAAIPVCKSCGSNVRPEARFCARCGTPTAG